MHRSYYVEGTELHLCDLDPKVKVIGQKAGIRDGVPLTSALVLVWFKTCPFAFCLFMFKLKYSVHVFKICKICHLKLCSLFQNSK